MWYPRNSRRVDRLWGDAPPKSMTDLHQQRLSLDHTGFVNVLSQQQDLLIIQDLDGVCMQLVKDPLTRTIDPDYVTAIQAFQNHFFVLTNGEHIGSRGVNRIIERSLPDGSLAKQEGLYLPGLAAGGVQWQNPFGEVSHPGVNPAVIEFLGKIPQLMETKLQEYFQQYSDILDSATLAKSIAAAILDNKVSPTVNLNVFHETLQAYPEVYRSLQQQVAIWTDDLMTQAQTLGLTDDFFIHYAPNLGLDKDGNEIILMAEGGESGTTDFQFMVKGARKEVGVLFLLNQYVGKRTGNYPLGEDFHGVGQPQDMDALLNIIQDNFAPEQIPLMVGVGDTVTSQGQEVDGQLKFFRGGSDRGFLQLIQNIGQAFNIPNLTVYVDSSAGEVKNRKPLQVDQQGEVQTVIEGPTDHRDHEDPLKLNVAIPKGHQQYIQLIQQAARLRSA